MQSVSMKILSHASVKNNTKRLRGFKFHTLTGRFKRHYGNEGVNFFTFTLLHSSSALLQTLKCSECHHSELSPWSGLFLLTDSRYISYRNNYKNIYISDEIIK